MTENLFSKKVIALLMLLKRLCHTEASFPIQKKFQSSFKSVRRPTTDRSSFVVIVSAAINCTLIWLTWFSSIFFLNSTIKWRPANKVWNFSISDKRWQEFACIVMEGNSQSEGGKEESWIQVFWWSSVSPSWVAQERKKLFNKLKMFF